MNSEKNSLTSAVPTLARREFIMGSLITGFALAVQPIQAQTQIITDSNGLIAGEVKIPVKDGVIPAYRAMPDTKGKKFPTVLVVQEIFGVHEHIKDVCRRFAKLGHCAIAPELYARQGDPSKYTMENLGKLISEVVSKVPDSQVMSDLDATVEFAKKNGGDTKKLAITGFCWGGRITWLYAEHNPQVKAGGAWYGQLVRREGAPKNDLQPTMPIDGAATLKVPVIGFYGGKDTGISQESIEQMRKELAKGKSKSEINVYPDAQHGFNADYRPSYKKDDAENAWKKLNEWFKTHGAA